MGEGGVVSGEGGVARGARARSVHVRGRSPEGASGARRAPSARLGAGGGGRPGKGRAGPGHRPPEPAGRQPRSPPPPSPTPSSLDGRRAEEGPFDGGGPRAVIAALCGVRRPSHRAAGAGASCLSWPASRLTPAAQRGRPPPRELGSRPSRRGGGSWGPAVPAAPRRGPGLWLLRAHLPSSCREREERRGGAHTCPGLGVRGRPPRAVPSVSAPPGMWLCSGAPCGEPRAWGPAAGAGAHLGAACR